MTAPPAALLEDLLDWLRIPSISTGGGDPADLRRAAEWAAARVDAAGGRVELIEIEGGNPLVYGELQAAGADAPTVIAYGHYDVQGPGDLEAWLTPPFEPDIRDDRIYARGASDDKGNFLPLLHAACGLARAGELGVNVRLLVEGEEETTGHGVLDWIRADERGADCALIFDAWMADPQTPAITISGRGMVIADVEVRTAEQDVHSGIYGGPAMNAAHVLTGMLAAVLPDADGRIAGELRLGATPPDDRERGSWGTLPPGPAVLSDAGAVPVSAAAADEFYERTGADTSLDVNEISVGEPRTIVPAVARANLSVRTAPGQDSAEVGAALERMLRAAAPEGALLRIELSTLAPAYFDPADPALRLAAKALERACGRAPAFVRSGGTLPILAELSDRGIPTVFSGFGLGDDAIHAPNESYRLESLRLGDAAARELYAALAELPRG